MALADGKLQKFFSAQKIGAFDALKQKGKVQDSNRKDNNEELNSKTVEKKSVSKPLDISEHFASKEEAIKKQFVSKPLDVQEQLSSNSIANPLAEPLAIKFDYGRFNPNIDLQLSTYSKKERELLELIFWQCHNNCSLISPVISTEEIRNILQISPERVRNLIFRITKKGGLESKMSKSGQNACRIFELSKSLYQYILEDQTRKKNKGVNSLAEPLASSLATHDSSSNNKINTITLSHEWENIDLEPLSSIGLSKTQLMQLKDKNTPDIIQESIYHFAYGLKNNEKFKSYSDPLNVFMGVLRKGGAWFEKNYRSQQEIAMEQILEQKRMQHERENKLTNDLMIIEFEEWFAQLQNEEKENISKNFNIPASMSNLKSKDLVFRSKFFEFFKEKISSRAK